MESNKSKIDSFFSEETASMMKNIESSTQRAVDGWASEMIDKFVNDKVISSIDN